MIATIPFDALTGFKGFVVGEAAEIEDHTSRGRIILGSSVDRSILLLTS